MTRALVIFLFSFFAFILQAFSIPALAWNEGISLSIPVITKDPDDLHGFSGSIWYDPETLVWRQFHLYFDVVGAHYWVSGITDTYHDINIIAVSPVVRYLFKEHFSVTPYFELSVGAAYLSNTRFANRNMGMHFSFQDRGGLGFTFGNRQQFALGAHIVHYSNASLSSNNSGITIPLMVDLSYKFG
jgi:hypothetical protein